MKSVVIVRRAVHILVLSSGLALLPALCAAQLPGSAAPAADDSAELAKKLSNPIADLVSVPFQLNWEQGVGPDDQTRFVLNIQPVMPFSLNPQWNVIARVILPLVSQPPLATGGQPVFGQRRREQPGGGDRVEAIGQVRAARSGRNAATRARNASTPSARRRASDPLGIG